MIDPRMTIALVGCGIWGYKICRELLALGQTVHVFDPVEPVGLAVEWIPVNELPGLVELERCDAVVIATPATLTPHVLKHILPLNQAIFVEKPLATSTRQLDFLDPGQHTHIKMMNIWRYHPAVETLKELCDTQEIGQLLGIRSFRCGWTSPRTDIDSLWNLMVHDLTIAKEILGQIPATRYASAELHNGIVRGALIILGDNPYHWIELSNRYERKIREIRLHGTEGIAVWRGDDDAFVTLHLGSDMTTSEHRKEIRIPISTESALKRELLAFLDYVEGGSPPKSDLDEGIQLVHRIEELEQQIAKNASE